MYPWSAQLTLIVSHLHWNSRRSRPNGAVPLSGEATEVTPGTFTAGETVDETMSSPQRLVEPVMKME